jgi:hypothetical protein
MILLDNLLAALSSLYPGKLLDFSVKRLYLPSFFTNLSYRFCIIGRQVIGDNQLRPIR